MFPRHLKLAEFVFLLLAAITPAVAGDGIILNINQPACPYADPHLSEKLNLYLSAISSVPIVKLYSDQTVPADLNQLINLGRNLGGRYLVDVSVEKMDIIRKKRTIIPLAVCRYRIYGVLTATLRVIDLARGKTIKMDRIEYELKASNQWQFLEDDVNDPALILPADEKVNLFNRLEESAAGRLLEEIAKIIKDNHLGK
ncbi:MAG: hypothetical protein NT002_06045 [candidate division Zixibacteria bacterium]|jgi:hypothetical protein|nr:hypothetical protein [candidate division Zixibacteria bacterium]